MKRRVSSLTLVFRPVRRAYVNLAGCNFNCRACFAVAKDYVGRDFSVDEFLDFFIKACNYICGEIADEVVLTGGEPTINPDYLSALLEGLSGLDVTRIELSTNGHLLDEDYIRRLKGEGVSLVKVDLKAYSDSIYRWYTGESNVNMLRAIRLLRDLGSNFLVRTAFIPNIVDLSEIESIAGFLSSIDRKIPYRIFQFAPHGSDISRSPARGEMLEAFNTAKQHLDNVDVLLDVESYRSDWSSIEICADELLRTYQEVARRSTQVVKDWERRYGIIRMSEVLNP